MFVEKFSYFIKVGILILPKKRAKHCFFENPSFDILGLVTKSRLSIRGLFILKYCFCISVWLVVLFLIRTPHVYIVKKTTYYIQRSST